MFAASFDIHLPDHFLGDLLAAFAFGLAALVLVLFGFKAFDWITPKIDVERELAERQNVPVAIVTAAIILGICYVVAHVLTHIIGK